MNCIAFGFENGKIAIESSVTTFVICSEKSEDVHERDFTSFDNARQWVINHLDLSLNWTIGRKSKD